MHAHAAVRTVCVYKHKRMYVLYYMYVCTVCK